jgi:hypothetical protein
MFRACSLLDISELYSATWPKAGMMRAGVSYRLPNWERRISVIASGLWPTPRQGKVSSEEAETWLKRQAAGKVATPPLALAVQMWPTPRASDANGHQIQPNKQGGLGLNQQLGGRLNPDWVDWLIGWPIGWSDCAPLAMPKFQQWLRAHGLCLQQIYEEARPLG